VSADSYYLLAVGQAGQRILFGDMDRLSGLISLGTAFIFAFALVESLCGAQKRSEVISPMIFPSGTPL
jgi:hypothetical protein